MDDERCVPRTYNRPTHDLVGEARIAWETNCASTRAFLPGTRTCTALVALLSTCDVPVDNGSLGSHQALHFRCRENASLQ